MIESLPREIILDILSRLPVTTVVQIKLVCQAWRNLVQDPLLAHMHYSNMTRWDPSLILKSDCPLKNQIYYLDHNEGNVMVKKILFPPLAEFDLVGSCNGLLCLCYSVCRDTVYICNPFTGDCIELPQSNRMSWYRSVKVVLGFGFHPITKEYKVVKMANYGIPSSIGCHVWFTTNAEAEVFTLGSHTWRPLDSVPYRFIICRPQVLVNGILHWVAWQWQCRDDRLDRKFISFDLASEQFQEVPKPDCGSLNRGSCYLVDLKGCLSVAVHRGYQTVDIWVMKHYNVKESWIKEFSIGAYIPKGLEVANDLLPFRSPSFFSKSQSSKVVCVLKNGELLLEYYGTALVSYDPKSGVFKDLKYPGMLNWVKAVVHVGSLNWIEDPINI